MSLKSERSRVRRLSDRGHYDTDTVYRILDQNFLCHVAFVIEGRPYLIPTAYGRAGNAIYLHGSAKSRMMTYLASGGEAAVAVTQVDAIVLARSLFHSSMNYQSVVVYGKGQELRSEEEKTEGLRVVSENIWQGRWNEARPPDATELKATSVIRIEISEGAAKIRTGPAKDNPEDCLLDIWAGLIPVRTYFDSPVGDEKLDPSTPLPDSVRRIMTE